MPPPTPTPTPKPKFPVAGLGGILNVAPPPPTPTIWVGGWQDPQLGDMYYIGGDGFSLGQYVDVKVVANGTGIVMWEQTVTASARSGEPGGTIGVPTDAKDCSAYPNTDYGYYMIAEDMATHTWSNQMPMDSYDC